MEGIKSLEKKYEAILEANAGFEKTNYKLDTEDDILAKVPQLKREQIKVSCNCQAQSRLSWIEDAHKAHRDGKVCFVKMADGWLLPRPSMQSAIF